MEQLVLILPLLIGASGAILVTKLMKPNRRHLYQFLVNEKKVDHWEIATIYGFIQITISILMIKLKQTSFSTVFVTYLCLMMLFIVANNQIKK